MPPFSGLNNLVGGYEYSDKHIASISYSEYGGGSILLNPSNFEENAQHHNQEEKI